MKSASENGKTTRRNRRSFGYRPGAANRNASYTSSGKPMAIAPMKQTVIWVLNSSRGANDTICATCVGTT